MKPTILIICQHFSTGGMPQYTLKIAEKLKKEYDVQIVEVNNYSDEYTVQRKKVPNILQMYGNQKELFSYIKGTKPDIIYFQELPETYLDYYFLQKIYINDDWLIWVTTHSSKSTAKDFTFIPNKIIAVNTWQEKLFEDNFPSHTFIEKWEYPVEDKVTDKLKAKMILGMTGYNVLNVGLFTPSKNQGELFEVARQNTDKTYHFVGNQAINFKDYWEPLMANKPDNCIIWGERSDTDLFYQACDEMYFTSKFELCPIVLKEALSWKLPVKIYKLPSYGVDYDNNPLVTYLQDIKIQNNYNHLKNIAIQEIEVDNIYEKYFKIEKGDVVVDIGAHVGIFTKKALNAGASRVVAIEPDPLFIKELDEIKSDKLQVFELAISAKDGKSTIVSNGNPNEIGKGDVIISTTTFKKFCKATSLLKIDFLKLDCEGGEYDIFTKENMEWLSNNVKNIVGELHIHTEEQKAYIPYMLMLIKQAGFNLVITSVDGFIVQDVTKHLNYYKEVLFYITKQPMQQPFSIHVNYIKGAFIELKGLPEGKYTIEFINQDTGEIPYKTVIGTNCWAKCNIEYFVNWTIKVYKGDSLYQTILFNLSGAKVYIPLESKSLGDTLAWFPYVEEFRKKHNCKVVVSTFLNELFENTYPELEFVKPGQSVIDIHAQYCIGWYYNDETVNINKNPLDPKKQRLQKTASDILGLEYKEIKPKLDLPEVLKNEKTVSLGIHSTTQAKYWNNPTGWQEVCDYINSKNYVPLIISKEKDGYMGNTHPKGAIFNKEEGLENLIGTICSSTAFIGIGSGLSWLAWACNIPVILISGFSEDYTEMQDCIRISSPENVCKGCFNKYKLNAGDWNWCPEHKNTPKQFECTKNITHTKIIDNLQQFLN